MVFTHKNDHNELYVWINGELVYKSWLGTGQSKVFDVMAYDRHTLYSITDIPKKRRNGTLEPFETGDKVIYIPKNLLYGRRSKMIQEENLGIVKSKNEKYVFVKYRNGVEATAPDDLWFLHTRPDLSAKITWTL